MTMIFITSNVDNNDYLKFLMWEIYFKHDDDNDDDYDDNDLH